MSGFPPTPGAGDGPYSGPPPRRWHHPGNGWVTPTKKLVLGILVFVLFCTVCFVAWGSYQIDRTQQAVLQNQREVAENRAVGCQLLLALGQPLPTSCADQEVLRHYDPSAPPGPTRTTGLICEIGKQVGIAERDLPPVCAEVDGDG
jgi:hypothetical protein